MEEQLLSVVREVVDELHRGRRSPPVQLDSKLSDELGLDSLGRLELLMRLERRLGLRLPGEEGLEVETPRQLLRALETQAAAAPVAPPARTGGPPAPVPEQPPAAPTVIAALEWFARHAPDRIHMDLYEGEEAVPVTYGELWAETERVAASLLDDGIERGESVALMLPTSRDFFVAFAGVERAGAVPVPIYPPFRASQVEEHLRRQALILDNAHAGLMVTSPETARAGRWLRAALPRLRRVTSVAALEGAAGAPTPPVPPPLSPSDVALVQYTSGSTGDPKGVVLTHANLLANLRALGEVSEVRATDVFVSWLPLYHDMGLIGAWLGSLYHGFRLVVMSPTRFLSRPESWLWALHHHRGTISAAPNFAYEICATRIPDDALAGLDLGAWRLAFNGSEPVSPATVERFARRFAPHGFRREAMTPVYGLAENSLGLTVPPLGRGPRIDAVARAPFEERGRAEPAGDDEPAALRFVSGGPPVPGEELRVVDDGGRELPDRREGRIQFRGPSATAGYLRNERATQALRAGDWLETGDRGYVADGELFVTGRSKDVIIRGGRHIFPYELEELVGAIPGARRGGVAVFAVPDERTASERLVVVAETRVGVEDRAGQAALRDRIDAQAAALLGAAPEEIVLVPARTIPKTSSGKTRRVTCRALYLGGGLGTRRSVRRQLLALEARALVPLSRRLWLRVGALAYAARFWASWALLAPAAWLMAQVVPGARRRWRAVAAVVRAFFRAAGIPIETAGLERLPAGPCVLTFNHASFIDGLALLAVLPPGFSFVGKSDLRERWLLRRPLRRLGVLFVERFDVRQSLEDAAQLEQRVRHGRSLIVFPEGTNRRTPGLFPFHLGAFLAAARAGVPVVPGVLTGTRTVLRSDQWFPRRAPIRVTLLAPESPAGGAWAEALSLRDHVRATIADRAGEPLVG